MRINSTNLIATSNQSYVTPFLEVIELQGRLNLLESLSAEGSISDFDNGEYEDFQ